MDDEMDAPDDPENADELEDEELEDDELVEEELDDVDPVAADSDDEDDEDDDEDQPAAARAKGAGEDEDDDEDLDPDDVEADLDAILKDRIAAADDDDEDEAPPDDRADPDNPERVAAKSAEEFTCSTCFMIVHPRQFGRPGRLTCPEGYDPCPSVDKVERRMKKASKK